MENKEIAKSIPFIVYEGAQERNERTVKRLTITLIIVFILMFLSNAIWLYCWMQFDYVDTSTEITYSQDGLGVNNINTGEQGDLKYYEPETDH